MTPDNLIRRCHELAGFDPDAEKDADSLIGFFQMFRPDGRAVAGLFDELDVGVELERRLVQLYLAAGDDRRPQGGRDAYFIIRNPSSIDPDLASELGSAWLGGVREIALALGQDDIAEMLAPPPVIRVLEGIPPKHPKDDAEKSHLLRTVQTKAAELVESISVESMEAGPIAEILRPAYYFTCCDTMIRDYLMWPMYSAAVGLADPLEPYFRLWSHGVKYRIYGESGVDLYLPRRA